MSIPPGSRPSSVGQRLEREHRELHATRDEHRRTRHPATSGPESVRERRTARRRDRPRTPRRRRRPRRASRVTTAFDEPRHAHGVDGARIAADAPRRRSARGSTPRPRARRRPPTTRAAHAGADLDETERDDRRAREPRSRRRAPRARAGAGRATLPTPAITSSAHAAMNGPASDRATSVARITSPPDGFGADALRSARIPCVPMSARRKRSGARSGSDKP